MTRQDRLRADFVEFLPTAMEEGVLYVSTRFKTAAHLCCCGCGFEVVTPLNPAKWRLTDHGGPVSLYPSIGNSSFPCRSHYWLVEGRVKWAKSLTPKEIARARARDRTADQIRLGEARPLRPAPRSR